MRIEPLPVFEADADPRHRSGMTDEEMYARLEPPKTIVVRYGRMKLVGEFPYDGDAKPGCGTKVVARTPRGTELAEMLTTTCENAGCGKSVTRQEMLDYIEASGGRDYPFSTEGRILRIATVEDLNRQSELDSSTRPYITRCKELIREQGLEMRLVDVEPILGEEILTFYYTAEHRVDFRQLVRTLASEFKTRIEMRQVGARDEARLVADYERCGQYCCCKNFLKVLKPVSMRSAKVQKATLDPLKISGRCGRLMCCLRYEDQTYSELKKNLPRRKSRVGTVEGPGVVVDTKILVQLALVKLEHDGREIAVPIEELMDPENCPDPAERLERELARAEADPLRGLSPEEAEKKGKDGSTPPERRKRRRSRRRKRKSGEGGAEGKAPGGKQRSGRPTGGGKGDGGGPDSGRAGDAGAGEKPRKRRRRRRGGRGRSDRRGDGSGGKGGGGGARRKGDDGRGGGDRGGGGSSSGPGD